jgi:RNA polymerase sigma-70 factor, ECF subfamily
VTFNEKRLVQRLKKRDPRAFEQLVNRFQTPVFNLVYRMIGNRAEAEDLAQEVFVSIFKKIDGFRGDASLFTWIYRIASNHCKNRQKYLGRRQARPLSPELDGPELDSSRGVQTTSPVTRPDELVEGYQTERMIQQAIADLDEEHRLILVLRDIQSVSYEDISTITGLPLGTVKSRLHRARMSLKDKLAPYLRSK